jgi:hypothetical protein
MGGIGKTALAAQLAKDLAPQFDAVYWRSLRNAPPCAEWLAGAILFLSGQQVLPVEGEEARLRQLLELLRTRRGLLVLDNLETVLEPGAPEIRYRAGYAGYGQMLQWLYLLTWPARCSPPVVLDGGIVGPARCGHVG